MNVKELAMAHWDYVKRLLDVHQVDEFTVRAIGFHYVEAFMHGYKHAVEERDAWQKPYDDAYDDIYNVWKDNDEDHYWSEYVSCHPVREVKSND